MMMARMRAHGLNFKRPKPAMRPGRERTIRRPATNAPTVPVINVAWRSPDAAPAPKTMAPTPMPITASRPWYTMNNHPRMGTCCRIGLLLLVRVLRRLHQRLGRQIGLLPCIPAAQQRGSVLDSLSIEVEHRTGACVFIRSSTVSDQELLLRESLEVRGKLSQREVQRPFDVLDVELVLRADID